VVVLCCCCWLLLLYCKAVQPRPPAGVWTGQSSIGFRIYSKHCSDSASACSKSLTCCCHILSGPLINTRDLPLHRRLTSFNISVSITLVLVFRRPRCPLRTYVSSHSYRQMRNLAVFHTLNALTHYTRHVRRFKALHLVDCIGAPPVGFAQPATRRPAKLNKLA
jgi:hypothetical protein